MKNLFIYFLFFLFLIFGGCKKSKNIKELSINGKSILNEESLYRPDFHFTPKANWMNDPNGLFYYRGIYHMYFQYYPEGNVWGPMHWGHAISKDLVNWEEKEIALYPDSLGYIFSGSAVVDIHNTSGFGTLENPPIVAMYTYHDMPAEKAGKVDYQTQAIAYSLDDGYTWTKYEGNPVIKNPGINNFRDPKVSWDSINNSWLMTLATTDENFIYRSDDLINWTLLQKFGEGLGAKGVWECPDFFPMKVEGTDETKWVLLQNLNPGGLNGGSGIQYFIGDFDGTTFTLDPSFEKDLELQKAIWLDYGRDNYAGVTWSNIPDSDGRKLFIGWMSNWDYAQVVPTKKWRSAMTLARELKLVKNNNQYRVYSNPVKELDDNISKTINQKPVKTSDEVLIGEGQDIDFNRVKIEFRIPNINQAKYVFTLFNSVNEKVIFGYDNVKKEFFSDRSKAGDLSFSDKFGATQTIVPIYDDVYNELKVELVLDKTSFEVFYNDGKSSMTEIFFLSEPLTGVSVHANGNEFELSDIKISQLKFD
ncbi:glycoside hydrolase family 32 protein [Urechidicola croceus]|uniref:Glycosyl hydrolase family 32 n=1 Tax=Urechidicola croceus TaxID=1850246 RepID=A0A1D8P4Z1_9FLAO|nr:glycoside hydrolase family 32 protein [Urechidicola croceus]AOW19581.1 glycosyl hydrolase family 32 [Urechidicola croceus]